MSTTTATAAISQDELDTQAYAAYLANGKNATVTARELGVSRSTLSRRINRHEVQVAQRIAVVRANEEVLRAGIDAAVEAGEMTVFTGPESLDPPEAEVTAHDARMATGEDGCNDASHDHSRELTDAQVDAALADRYTDRHDYAEVPEADEAEVPAETVTRVPDSRILRIVPEAEAGEPEVAEAPAAPAKASQLPDGVVSPAQFRDLLIAEGGAPDSLPMGNVYNWVQKKVGGFPARHYAADGTVYDDHARPGTRPGVDVAAGLAWYAARGTKPRAGSRRPVVTAERAAELSFGAEPTAKEIGILFGGYAGAAEVPTVGGFAEYLAGAVYAGLEV